MLKSIGPALYSVAAVIKECPEQHSVGIFSLSLSLSLSLTSKLEKIVAMCTNTEPSAQQPSVVSYIYDYIVQSSETHATRSTCRDV